MLTRIKRWLEPPHFEGDAEKNHQAQLTNTLILYFALVLIFATVIFVPFFAKQKLAVLAIIFILWVLGALARHLMFRGKIMFARTLLLCSIWVLFQGVAIFAGGIFSPVMFAIVDTTIIISLLLKSRIGNVFVVASVLTAFGLAVLQTNDFPLPTLFVFSPLVNWLWFGMALVFMTGTMNLIVRQMENALASARHQDAVRAQTEASLRASEARNAALLRAMPDLFFQISRAGVILDYHAPKESKLYVPPEMFLGKNLTEIMPPQVADAALKAIADAVRAQAIVTFEYALASSAGSRAYENRIVPVSETEVLSVARDITARKQTENLLRERDQQFRSITAASPDALLVTRLTDGLILYANEQCGHLVGIAGSALINRRTPDFYVHPADRQNFVAMLARGYVSNWQVLLKRGDGTPFWAMVSARRGEFEGDAVIYAGIRDITDNKRAEEELAKFKLGIERSADAIFITDPQGVIIYTNPAFEKIYGYTESDAITQTPRILKSGMVSQETYEKFWATLLNKGIVAGEITNRTKDGRHIVVEGSNNPILDAAGNIIGFLGMHRDITERKRAEETLRLRESYLTAIIENQPGLVWLKDTAGRFLTANQAFADSCGKASPAEMAGKTDLDIWPQELAEKYRADDARVMERKSSVIVEEPIFDHGKTTWFETFKTPVLDDRGDVIGTTGYAHDITERKHHEQELHAIAALGAALRTASSRAEMLPVIVEQLVTLLNCETASIEIIDPLTGDAVTEAGYGEWKSLIGIRQKRDTGVNAIISHTRQSYSSNDWRNDPNFAHPELIHEGTRAGIGAPLIAQDKMIGFVWMGRRTDISKAQVRLLSAIADIAANAIHRTTLHEQTQQDAANLALAYDTTLEGWARALELRDQETIGHTRRVVQMTLDLARAMGVSENEIENIRRGALLHDIGKMGIPDSVLLKPGTLNEREWEIMKRHPEYASNLLAPIDYLRQAMDIPYCHHEKWDGTGYPRELVGDAIPLAARIFAIVDVWDALCSDRPYRKAWLPERAIEYIRSQAGKHFDPRVVATFLKLIR